MGKLFHSILDSLKLTDEDDDLDDESEAEDTDVFNRHNVKQEKEQVTPLRRYENPIKKSEPDEYDDKRFTGSYGSDSASLRKTQKSPYVNRTRESVPDTRTRIELRAELASSNGFVLRPTSFEDSKIVCDVLKQKGFVMLNFEGVPLEISQRLMDFACGVVYALDGKLYRLSEYTFIISPRDMDIDGDVLKKIAGDGMNLIVPTLTTPDD